MRSVFQEDNKYNPETIRDECLYEFRKYCSMEELIFQKELTLIKSNKLKECIIFHFWSFKDIVYKSEPYVCNKCHDISMMPDELENTAVLN